MTVPFALVLLVFLLVGGMPVAFALGVAGAVGLLLQNGFAAMSGILEITPYRTAASFLMTTIPMFVLMAELASESKLTKQIFIAVYRWMGQLPGGLAMASVIASAGFAAISGSSTASAATLSSMAMPEMKKFGYNSGFSAGVISIAGTLAIMIPPSIAFILYGIITEVSIGKLFMAGVMPGILTAFGYCIAILISVKLKKGIASEVKPFTFREKAETLKPIWPILILIFLVMGGIYSGAVTATEAGAVGAMGAFLIAVLIRRTGKSGIWSSLERTAQTTTMIFSIIIGAMIFSYFVTTTQTTQKLINLVAGSNLSNGTVLFIIIGLYLFLGCILDQIAILLLTLPIIFPLITSIGYDPIWFGVIVVKTAEIGLVTPPLGMNVYVVAASSKVPIEDVFIGVLPFVAIDLVILAVLCAVPEISLWLPNFMSK